MSRIIARSALVALACVVTMLSVATHAEERHLKRGHVDAYFWTPDTDARARPPVVVFSHGLFQCANQSRFITGATAAAGYVVIAPNHADAICSFNREARDEPRSDYSIAFLECYAKGEPESALLQAAEPGVTALRRDVGAAERHTADIETAAWATCAARRTVQ